MKKLLYIFLIVVLIIASTTTYVSGNPQGRSRYIEGFIKDWEGDRLKVEEYDGTIHLLPFEANALLLIDGIFAEPVDFKIGTEVYIRMGNTGITYLEGFSAANPGYIPAGSKVRNGVIKAIDRNQIVLKLPTGDEETYFTSPVSIAMKEGVNIPLEMLYQGDKVRLFFDEINTSIISRIHVEGKSVIIRELYRGKLDRVDYMEDVITLDNLEKYENSNWKSVGSSRSIAYSGNVPVYMGGYVIPYRDLKYYRGKEVYMAVKDYFGTERVEKMVLKNQYEYTYWDKIEGINWYTGAFELSDKKNIMFNEGTIIVKNGRLVDQYAINSGSDAFIVADGRGSTQTADVIYIYNEDLNNSNSGQYGIFAGRLDEITQYRILMSEFFLLDRNKWESYQRDKEMYYDNDTYIYDLEALKRITPQEFLAGDYAVDETSSVVRQNRLKDWYAYIYADGDRVLCAGVQKDMDSLLKQRITNGVVERVYNDDLGGWTLVIKNGADWSEKKENWMPKSTDLRLIIEKALIIKNGKSISQDEIVVGDRLYIVRDDLMVKMIIVK